MKKFLPLSLLLAAHIATVQSAEVITDAAPSTENQIEVAEQTVVASEAQQETAIPTKDTTNDNRWEATFEHLQAAEKKMKSYEDQILSLKKDIDVFTSLNELENRIISFGSNSALLISLALCGYAIKRQLFDNETISITSPLLALSLAYSYLFSKKAVQPKPELERMQTQLKELEEGRIEAQQEYTKAYYVHLNTAVLVNKNPGVPAWQAPQIETEKN